MRLVPVTGVETGSTLIHASAAPFVPDTTATVTMQPGGWQSLQHRSRTANLGAILPNTRCPKWNHPVYLGADLGHTIGWPEAQLYNGPDQWNTNRASQENAASVHGHRFDGTGTIRQAKSDLDDPICATTTADTTVAKCGVSENWSHAHLL